VSERAPVLVTPLDGNEKEHMTSTSPELTATNDLDILKQQMYERSMQSGSIDIIGTLGGENTSKLWTGSISLAKRLDSGELLSTDIAEAVNFLGQCYVSTQKGARIRCIDGRYIESYDDDNPAKFGRILGPQAPGGTPVKAIAYRLSVGGKDDRYENADLAKDIHLLAGKAVDLGYIAGDHVDNNDNPGKTGCRAIDNIEEHCENINPKSLSEIEDMTKNVLGELYNPGHFDHLIASSSRLLAVKESYFLPKGDIIEELIRHNPDGAPTLVGNHAEIAVILNMVPNETFHRDHFSSKFNGDMQAFSYDIYHTFDTAKSLFPDDPISQSKYIHVRVGLAISALMDLTDGSPLLGVRRPTS